MTLCTPPCFHVDYCAHYGCPFVREASQEFGCVRTGSNIHTAKGQSANSNSEPRARDGVAGSGVTAAPIRRAA